MPRRRPQWASQLKRNPSLAAAFDRSFAEFNKDRNLGPVEREEEEEQREKVDERTPMLGPRMRLMNGALAQTELRNQERWAVFEGLTGF